MKIIDIQFEVKAIDTVECIHSIHLVDCVLHEKSSINSCTLFASAILVDEAISFDNPLSFL